jgi:hypothetical protein
VESQQTYAVYMARLLCYSLRVLQSCEDGEKLGETADEQATSEADERSDYATGDERSSEREDEGDEGDEHDPGSPAAVDVFKDARRLYPWQDKQRDSLRRARESIEGGWDEKAQLDALLRFYESLIFLANMTRRGLTNMRQIIALDYVRMRV